MFFKTFFVSFSLIVGLSIQLVEASYSDKPTDLTRSTTLKPLLAEEFQDENHLSKASEIASRIYEVKMRPVANRNTYGFVCPLYPEVLRYAMQKAKGKVILEIGGASGENAILLAFAGAQYVYLNDIERVEIDTFNQQRNKLPEDVQSRLGHICCNIFDILNHKPDLSVDFILCRNVIHFFKDEQLSTFFELLKRILRPQGEVIFTVNSLYSGSLKNLSMQYPQVTRFSTVRCILTNDTHGPGPWRSFYEDSSVCEEDNDPLSFTRLVIREKKSGYPWATNKDQFNQLDHNLQRAVLGAMIEKENKEDMNSVKSGQIFVTKNTLRGYTVENLSTLFNVNGFEIEHTFLINNRHGHVYPNGTNPWKEIDGWGAQVGIIAKAPSVT